MTTALPFPHVPPLPSQLLELLMSLPLDTALTPPPAAATHPPAPSELPTAGEAVAHTLLNCLVREVSGPERQTAVVDGHLLLRMPWHGVLLRVALRRASLFGAHRFTGPVTEQREGQWAEVDWQRLAEHTQTELWLRTGVRNEEFLEQVVSSHQGVSAALAQRAVLARRETVFPRQAAAVGRTTATAGRTTATAGRDMATAGGPAQAVATGRSEAAVGRTKAAPGQAETAVSRAAAAAAPRGDWLGTYLASEQSLLLGHRFHPTPKARTGDSASWTAYAPEAGAAFPLRHLAVPEHLVAEESAVPGATEPLDRLHPTPDGYRLLPAHPWQYRLLRKQHPGLRAALERGDILDLGPGRVLFTPTASVRTVYDGDTFLKFSLNVRITNCLRKNSRYELSGAVALTRVLAPFLADLTARFPGSAMLREPAYRSLVLPGPSGAPDLALFEGFGVIVREGLAGRLLPGTTPLLAAAVADEYPTGPGHISRLLDGAGPRTALEWWRAYLKLLIPPVLAAYFDHGLVLEPHLQNVVICVDRDGMPAQVVFRDFEGTKLVPEQHVGTLASLPAEVAVPMTYDAQRGWDRVVYCLLVNHVAELLAALADQHPHLEAALWAQVRATLREYADEHGCPPRLRALLAGVPLPAKANLLTRWERKADREAGYVRLPSPLAEEVLFRGHPQRPFLSR